VTPEKDKCISGKDAFFLNHIVTLYQNQIIMEETLEINVKIQILKPVHDVFEAIIIPEKMSNYFISHSTGRMEEGKTLMWRFPEFDMEFPVYVGKIIMDSLISYSWDIDNNRLQVEMQLVALNDSATLITITEKSMKNNEAGIKWLKQNTEGWANFLSCLKAWVEYGINLRKGAFDFMKNPG
jgi:uncharacterized protein YndB with AHSA1/START domain